jgi:hypothetical protein
MHGLVFPPFKALNVIGLVHPSILFSDLHETSDIDRSDTHTHTQMFKNAKTMAVETLPELPLPE